MTQIPRRRHTPDNISLSPAMEDYLKTIFALTRDGGSASTQKLAERLDVSPASTTKMVKRLAESRLVIHKPYQGVALTESGRKIAVEIVRHHRLLELYLTQALGFTWDEVHEEAERLEHYISEKLEARICEFLGNPSFDPHGSPIPTLDGDMPRRSSLRLDQTALHELYQVTRVEEPDSGRLQTLAQIGLVPGVTVVTYGRPVGGKVHLKVGRQEHLISPELCRTISCRAVDTECFPAEQLEPDEVGKITQFQGRLKADLAPLGVQLGASLRKSSDGFVLDDGPSILRSTTLGKVLVELFRG
jgi:DtxR family transcriptional regulator, Mn-dependent transcriptional regulator